MPGCGWHRSRAGKDIGSVYVGHFLRRRAARGIEVVGREQEGFGGAERWGGGRRRRGG